MTDDTQVVEIRQRIAVAAAVALLVAGLVLVMFVLPAEYGVDPLGTGARVGLVELGVVGQEVAALEAAAQETGTDQVAIIVPQDRAYQGETVEFAVAAGEGMEYKYRLDQGEAPPLYLDRDGAGQLRAARGAGWRASRLRAELRVAAGREPGVGHVDRALFGHSWMVLGEPERRRGDCDAYGRRVLQHLPRIPRRVSGH